MFDQPHRFNNGFKAHPDWAINIIEEVASQSFLAHTTELQRKFGMPVKYFLTVSGVEKPVAAAELGASYHLLPALLMVNVQRTYNLLFKDSDFPLALYRVQPEDEMSTVLPSIPVIQSSDNFAALLHIINFEIEQLINRELVKQVLPFANVKPYERNYLRITGRLQQIITERLTENEIKEIPINLQVLVDDYNKLITNSFEDYSQPLIEPDMVALTELVAQQHEDEYIKPIMVEFVERDKVSIFRQPEFSSALRFEIYKQDEENEREREINMGSSGKKPLFYGL